MHVIHGHDCDAIPRFYCFVMLLIKITDLCCSPIYHSDPILHNINYPPVGETSFINNNNRGDKLTSSSMARHCSKTNLYPPLILQITILFISFPNFS